MKIPRNNYMGDKQPFHYDDPTEPGFRYQRSNSTFAKDLQDMISYRFSYFVALESIIREMQGLFSMITLLDLEAGVKGQISHLQKVYRL